LVQSRRLRGLATRRVSKGQLHGNVAIHCTRSANNRRNMHVHDSPGVQARGFKTASFGRLKLTAAVDLNR
jgi:hypothetical protein